jgi:hypothetical protein
MNLLNPVIDNITGYTLALSCGLSYADGEARQDVDDALRDYLIEVATGITPGMPDPAGHGTTAADMFDVPCSEAIKHIQLGRFDEAAKIIDPQLALARKINAFIENEGDAERDAA